MNKLKAVEIGGVAGSNKGLGPTDPRIFRRTRTPPAIAAQGLKALKQDVNS